MEDFNSKYTGEQVEELLDQVANGELGGITVETDPVFSASPAASITNEKMDEWDNKQDAIADLETIRSNASKGATALQSVPEEYVTEEQLIWTKVEGEAGVRLKGTNGTATGNFAISAGDDKTASDGTEYKSVASGDHAVAFGYGNTCSGRTTLAQGLYNIVTGKDCVAFGQKNTVGGQQAFAVGMNNEITAPRNGIALGYGNKVTVQNGITLGWGNVSNGDAAIAMGDACEASATSAVAMGYQTKAGGSASVTFGKFTKTTGAGEAAMGEYNQSVASDDAAEQTAFSFGIGTSDTNRKNALEIKKNGDVYIGDKLLSGGGITEETDPIFSASPAAGITEKQIVAWDDLAEMVNLLDKDVATLTGDVQEVQESLTDLDTIRSGAAKGATAVQPGDIENVARLDEEYVVANGIVSKEDVYYHLPNTNTSDAAHTLATKGDLSSTIETYIADFTIASLRKGIYDGIDVKCYIQALVDAMNANKIILVRDDADSSYKGVYVLNGYAEDLLYFSIVDSNGDVLYCDGTDYVYTKSYINGQALFYRNWFDKQDTLVSGENIKTINGENILGSGDITIEGGVGTITGVSANGTSIATSGVADIPAASTSKYGVTKLTTLTNSSSTTLAATASAVKIAYDLANSKQDKLESGTNIKTINGASILGSGDITISGGSSGGGKEYIVVEPDLSIAGSEAYIADIVPNTTYIVSEPVSLLSINEFSVSDALSDEYNVIFKADYEGTTLTINSYNRIFWANGVIPTIEPAAVYELSIQRVNIGGGNFFNSVLTYFKIIE